jgi:poly(3-hydroxybutyrate) depolymerase
MFSCGASGSYVIPLRMLIKVKSDSLLKPYLPSAVFAFTPEYDIMKPSLIFLLALISFQLSAQTPDVKRLTARNHLMQYYISLPKGWSKNKLWPVVVAVEAAEKEFEANAKRFAEARKDLPFIIVVPINVTNGSQGQKDPKIYPYTTETWNKIDADGICSFDLNGLQEVIKDVHDLYQGEEKVFLTGFEAGAHLVWAMTFQHPELLWAAVPVAGNYRNRCMSDDAFSKDDSKKNFPITAFAGDADEFWGPSSGNHNQWQDAKLLAIKHGYKNINETVLKGVGHIPIPKEVLDYFNTLRK